MKKLLVFLLTLIMVFSFTACGKLTASNSVLTASVSSFKAKKLTITLKGDISDCDISFNYPGITDGEKFFDIETKSVDEEKIKLSVVGWNSGTATFSVFLKENDNLVATVTGQITVYEGLKMQCTDIRVQSDETLQLKEEEDDNVVIPILSGQNDILNIKKDDGYWSAVSTSGPSVGVSYLGVITEGYDRFQIYPLAAGDLEVVFVNDEEYKQLRVYYTVTGTLVEEDGETTTEFTVAATDYQFEDYDQKAAAERSGKDELGILAEKLDPNFKLPSDYAVSSLIFYNYDTYEATAISDPSTFDAATLPDYVNAFCIEAQYKDDMFQYVRTGATTLKAEKALLDTYEQTYETQELTYGDRAVTLYTFANGFNIALWESEGKVYKVTFMFDDPTGDLSHDLLDEMLLN